MTEKAKSSNKLILRTVPYALKHTFKIKMTLNIIYLDLLNT